MSPSTTVPQDAFKGAARPGWWTCHICGARERGGMADWTAHYLAHHWVEVKP